MLVAMDLALLLGVKLASLEAVDVASMVRVKLASLGASMKWWIWRCW
jgi:hypothetical protein